MITGVVGITLWTDDLERLFRFYQDVLRLPLHSNHGDFIAFQLGENMRFNLGLHDRVAGAAKDPYRVMPHLEVTDIHEEHRRLTDAGVEFLRPPEQEYHIQHLLSLLSDNSNLEQSYPSRSFRLRLIAPGEPLMVNLPFDRLRVGASIPNQ